METIKKLLFASFAVLLFSIPSFGATYYVSTSGSNGAAGTLGSPWRNIYYCESQMGSGDTCYIRGGTYNENMTVNVNNVTFEAYNNETPIITGPASGTGSSVVVNSNYVTFRGINFKRRATNTGHSTHVHQLDFIGANHCEVDDCEFYGNGAYTDWYSNNTAVNGIRISGAQYIYIHDSYLHDMSWGGVHIKDNGSTLPKYWRIVDSTLINFWANAVTFNSFANEMEYGLLEGCTIGGAITSDGFQTNDGSFGGISVPPPVWGVWVRNNVFYAGTFGYNTAENQIDMKGARYFVVENNLVQGSMGDNDGNVIDSPDHSGNVAIAHGTNSQNDDIIVRGNVIVDNGGGIQGWSGYRVYNNTIINNDRDYTGPNSGYGQNGITFYKDDGTTLINNIFGGASGCEVEYDTSDSASYADYNMYLSDTQTPTLCSWQDGAPADEYTFSAFQSFLSGQNIGGKEAHSLQSSAHDFENGSSASYGNPQNLNFQIGSSSDARDAGGPIATTTNSGSSSTSMYVSDGSCFSAGASVIGVAGDTLLIDGTTEVQVSSISGDHLTLTSAASWSSGDSVVWCKDGVCPEDGQIDIGAYEYESGAPPVYAVLSNGSPTGTVSMNTFYTLTVETDLNATVRYDTSPSTSYGDMILMSTTGGTSHSTIRQDLSAQGTIKNYYFKAYAGDDAYQVQFTIGTPPGNVNLLSDSTYSSISECFDGSGAPTIMQGDSGSIYAGSVADYNWIDDPNESVCWTFDLGSIYDFSIGYVHGFPGPIFSCQNVCFYFSNNIGTLYDGTPICIDCDVNDWEQSASIDGADNSRYVGVRATPVLTTDDLLLYEIVLNGVEVESSTIPRRAKIGTNGLNFYGNKVKLE